MATEHVTFGQIIGDYFTANVLPYLEIYDEEAIVTERNQYIADATTNPELVKEIEDFYGVTIW